VVICNLYSHGREIGAVHIASHRFISETERERGALSNYKACDKEEMRDLILVGDMVKIDDHIPPSFICSLSL